MSGQSKIAKNLERFRIAVNSHDRENPTCSPAYGIGLAYYDMARLGFEHGEELWPSIRIEVDGGTSGNFRVLCDGEHDKEEAAEAEQEVVNAIGVVA